MIETSLQTLPHGITLSCRSAGARGRPVLMFLHGFPEAAFVWDGLLAHFAKPENGGYRCVAPNLRGFERSSAPTGVAAYRPKHLVQDIAALIALEGGQLACLVAHDWGGAVAWNLTAAQPDCMKKLAIINSPHPGTFLRELQHSPAQQAASAYMNFLTRPDAETLLAKDDFRRLWQFLTNGAEHQPAWLTASVKDQYREVWRAGLSGGCNLYRASPLRPPRPGPPHNDPAAAAVTIPRAMLEVHLPTQVPASSTAKATTTRHPPTSSKPFANTSNAASLPTALLAPAVTTAGTTSLWPSPAKAVVCVAPDWDVSGQIAPDYPVDQPIAW